MVYEFRVYHVCPGKMEAIVSRFKDHAFTFLAKNGITVVDFWTDAEGKDIVYYLCEFESMAAAKLAWDTHLHDPLWLEIKQKTEADGPLVFQRESFFMERPSFFNRP